MIDESAIRSRFEALAPLLDERALRRFAAAEAQAAGRGGIAAVFMRAEAARALLDPDQQLRHAPLQRERLRDDGPMRRLGLFLQCLGVGDRRPDPRQLLLRLRHRSKLSKSIGSQNGPGRYAAATAALYISMP